MDGWIRTLESLETEAKVHENVAEKISSQMLPTSKSFIVTADRDLKQVGSSDRFNLFADFFAIIHPFTQFNSF